MCAAIPVVIFFCNHVEKPAVFEIVDPAVLNDPVPVGVAERDAAVAVTDRSAPRMAAHRQGQGFRCVVFGVDGRAQALNAIAVIGLLAVLCEGICQGSHRQVAAGHPQVFRQGGFGIVVRAGFADRREALGYFGIGTSDRILGDDKDTRASLRGSLCGMTARAAGAHHDHIVVAPFCFNRHLGKRPPRACIRVNQRFLRFSRVIIAWQKCHSRRR